MKENDILDFENKHIIDDIFKDDWKQYFKYEIENFDNYKYTILDIQKDENKIQTVGRTMYVYFKYDKILEMFYSDSKNNNSNEKLLFKC